MSKHTIHIEKCPECKKPVNELIWDKRDSKLKCIDCYDKKTGLKIIRKD
jgi:translation initiation factor 2 beta subunit (eIF-2beta)/eIF-5